MKVRGENVTKKRVGPEGYELRVTKNGVTAKSGGRLSLPLSLMKAADLLCGDIVVVKAEGSSLYDAEITIRIRKKKDQDTVATALPKF